MDEEYYNEEDFNEEVLENSYETYDDESQEEDYLSDDQSVQFTRLEVMRQKVRFMLKNIDSDTRKYSRLQKAFGQFGVLLKLLSLSFSAVVTVILGLNLEDKVFYNRVAMIISALTGVVAGLSAFFDFQQLSLKYKDTIDKLERLKIKLQYYNINIASLEPQILDALMQNMLDILKETHDFFQAVRSDDKVEDSG